MARRPASNVQRQKATMRNPVREANGARPFLSQAELVCVGAVFLVALIVYSWTLAPTVTLTDSGELIVAAYGLGVAHPPGFPLWIMLAHLASLVPVGNVAVRINFSSAVFAALACAMLTLVVGELLATASCFAARHRRNKAARQSTNIENSNAGEILRFAPAVGAELLMAFSRTLWSYATRMRGLADRTVRLAKDDVINVKVLPAYTRMLTNRGRYLALFNQHERAILACKEALALDPNLGPAQQGLAKSTAKVAKP